MKKVSLAIAALLLALGVVWAQQEPNSNSNTPANAGSQVTVKGCLGGSDGNYTLLGSDGMTYQLQGDDSQLKEHVGHTVAVTGTVGTGNTTTTNSNETTPNGASGTASSGEQRTLSVNSLQHISSGCSQTSTRGGKR